MLIIAADKCLVFYDQSVIVDKYDVLQIETNEILVYNIIKQGTLAS